MIRGSKRRYSTFSNRVLVRVIVDLEVVPSCVVSSIHVAGHFMLHLLIVKFRYELRSVCGVLEKDEVDTTGSEISERRVSFMVICRLKGGSRNGMRRTLA